MIARQVETIGHRVEEFKDAMEARTTAELNLARELKRTKVPLTQMLACTKRTTTACQCGGQLCVGPSGPLAEYGVPRQLRLRF